MAAKVHHTDHGTYSRLTINRAEKIQPKLEWAADRPARVGMVTVNWARRDQVVLSTASMSGQMFCAADSGAVT